MGFVLGTIRSILLDLPLIFLFSTLIFLLSLRHIHDEYLSQLMKNAFMSEDRVLAEYTYYERVCDVDDISTSNPNDIVMKSNSSIHTEEALETLLTHGAAVFPDLIHPSTATKLRDYVLDKNTRLKQTESVFVQEPQNRWSFNPGATDHPYVTQALKEISTNPLLRSTLERLLGPNPAVVEFNCITSAYGAESQGWHPDTEASKCHSDHARTYYPQFSLAIPLQDTTPQMGATSICPGTHFCATMNSKRCSTDGFQVQTHVANHTSRRRGRDGGGSGGPYWKTGYGLLYSQQTFHKGSAHIAYDGPHRVLFFLTFSSHHQRRKESRVPSFGTTYAMRWDMFGFTLNDLRDAKEAMRQPWAKLRALGLYYPPEGKENGWNWLTMMCIRVINGEVGYEERNLVDFLEDGHGVFPMQKIPKALIGEFVEEDDRELENSTGWYEFLDDTLNKCLYWAAIVYGGMFIVYIVVALIISAWIMWSCSRSKKKQQNTKHGAKTNGHVQNGAKTNGHAQNGSSSTPSKPNGATASLPKQRFMHSTLKRIFLSHTIIISIFAYIMYQISTTGWASDIKSGELYTAIFPHAGKEDVTLGANYDDDYLDTIAAVQKEDVLTGILQYPARHKIAAEGYLDYHPGNVVWKNKMKQYAISSSSGGANTAHHPLMKSYFSWASDMIVRDMLRNDHRFLIQNIFGNYELMPSGSAKELTRRALLKSSYGLVHSLDEELSYIMAMSRFGELRGTVMTEDINPMVVMKWRELIFSSGGQGHRNTDQVPEYLIPISVEPMKSMYDPVVLGRSKIYSKHSVTIKKPLGQSVLFKVSEKTCPSRWYIDLPGTTPKSVRLIDFLGEIEYDVDDEVETFPGGMFNQWYRGTIAEIDDDGRYGVELEDDFFDGVPSFNLRPANFQMMRMEMKEDELRDKIERTKSAVSPLQSNVEHVLMHSSSVCDVAECATLRSFPAKYETEDRYMEDGVLLSYFR